MKTNKIKKVVIAILLVLLGITITIIFWGSVIMLVLILELGGLPRTTEQIHFDDIKEKTGVSFKSCKIISSEDTHGGFPAEGYTKVVYNCGKEFDTTNIEKKWKKLPFSENLNIKLYGGATKYGIQYLEREEKNYIIPKIENGYYYFIDQYSREYKDTNDIYSDEKLIGNRYSTYYSLTVYDMDNDVLYYYDMNT